MSDFRFTLKRSGVAKLMKSEEMKAILDEKATAIRNRCGDGYEQDSYTGRNRANAMVWAESYRAKRDNLKHNTLLKAVSK